MTPGQIKKNWLSSARAWLRAAERYPTKRAKAVAEKQCWHSILRAVSGL